MMPDLMKVAGLFLFPISLLQYECMIQEIVYLALESVHEVFNSSLSQTFIDKACKIYYVLHGPED